MQLSNSGQGHHPNRLLTAEVARYQAVQAQCPDHIHS